LSVFILKVSRLCTCSLLLAKEINFDPPLIN
jgi:hypothetical protein